MITIEESIKQAEKEDLDRAYLILAPIPAEKWCVDEFQLQDGSCCVLGHLGVDDRGEAEDNFDNKGEPVHLANSIVKIFKIHLGPDIADINNRDGLVTGAGPKDRVMRAFKQVYDLIEAKPPTIPT